MSPASSERLPPSDALLVLLFYGVPHFAASKELVPWRGKPATA